MMTNHATPLGDCPTARMIRRAIEVRNDIETSGRQCTPRDLISRISKIKTAEQARALYILIGGSTLGQPSTGGAVP